MRRAIPLLLVLVAAVTTNIQASSHREAPFIAKNPKVDGADFYLFNSYESGRAGYVTILANYGPLQDAYGGPNYFTFDSEALYEIHIDNNGDGVEDLTFQFDFDSTLGNNGAGLTLDVGPAGTTKTIAVPYGYLAPLTDPPNAGQNVFETYKVNLVRGPRRSGTSTAVPASSTGATTFRKPFDNVGTKTIPNYPAYASAHIFDIDIPGCTPSGVPAGTKSRVFVGQRAEGFAVNLGQVFDLVNFTTNGAGGTANVVGAPDQGKNIVAGKNISTIALEVPASCLVAGASTTIGAWTTASVRQARVINPTPTYALPAREGGPFVQVSRLGAPLVNEVIIGLKDKDRFNSSEPKDDAQWADYVTNPTLPEVLEILFGAAGVVAPNNFPRTDLLQAFVTGVTGVNATVTAAEYLRLNTSFPPTLILDQNPLGALGCFDDPTMDAGAALDVANADCDPNGFPNGRRPIDDVVDIELRVAMGALVKRADAPAGGCLHATSTGCLPYVDGARLNSGAFLSTFPYLDHPQPGSP